MAKRFTGENFPIYGMYIYIYIYIYIHTNKHKIDVATSMCGKTLKSKQQN